MNKKARSLIIMSLALVLTLPTACLLNKQLNVAYHAEEQTEDNEEILPDVYFIGSGYTDAYPCGKVGEDIYYQINQTGNLVNTTKQNSTYAQKNSWKNYTVARSIKIPEKVGVYNVIGVEDVKPLAIDAPFPFTGKTITYQDIIDITHNTTLTPKAGTPFSQDDGTALVYNNTDGSLTPYKEEVIYTNRFTYSASKYSFETDYNETKRSLMLKCTTNWSCKSSEQNKNGDLWGSKPGLKPVAKDANEILNNIIVDNDKALYPGPSELQSVLGLSFLPTAATDPSLTACYARYYDKKGASAVDTNGAVVKSQVSKAYNKASWYKYWSSYIVPGGLLVNGVVQSTQFSWDRLWDGTYFNYLQAGEQNIRAYQPYVVKLKVSTRGLDLEACGSQSKDVNYYTCDAFYEKGYLYVKPLGNAVTLPAGTEFVESPMHLTITNESGKNVNTIEGEFSPQKLKVNKIVNYVKDGSEFKVTNSHLNGSVSNKDDYLRIPIAVGEENQKLTVQLEVNQAKDPEEVTYINNIWKREILIPGTSPDLSAEHILYKIDNNKIGSNPTVALTLITGDKDFDKILSYVENSPHSPTLYKIYVDGSLIQSNVYNHPIGSNPYRHTVTFQPGVLTNTKPSYRVKVELNINPNRNVPSKEQTFDNNYKVREFLIPSQGGTVPYIYTDEDPKPPEDPVDPQLPKFTNMEECVWLDKNSPSTNSVLLLKGGTFELNYTASSSGTFANADAPPSGSEVAWIKEGTSPKQGLNWGKIVGLTYDRAWSDAGASGTGWMSHRPREGEFVETPGAGPCSKCAWNQAWLDKANEILARGNYYLSSTNWNAQRFAQSQGSDHTVTGDWNTTYPYYRVSTRERVNAVYCHSNCCYGVKQGAGENAEPRDVELHQHITVTGTRTNPDTGKSETYEEEVCVGKSPKHHHTHEEWRLERLSGVTMQYNIAMQNMSTKTSDYGTGDKLFRAGYGVSAAINSAPYITDLQPATASGDYGAFVVKKPSEQACVKTPAVNKKKPFLITRLEGDKGNFSLPENPKSVMKYKELFADVDYPDGDFPVIYELMLTVNGFKPWDKQYLPAGEAALMDRFCNLPKRPGMCKTDHLTVKGNVWDDEWTHPTGEEDYDIHG